VAGLQLCFNFYTALYNITSVDNGLAPIGVRVRPSSRSVKCLIDPPRSSRSSITAAESKIQVFYKPQKVKMTEQSADVIVIGAGNAAFCAALAAQEQGAKVLMLEAAPEDESGGNSRFTAGSIRVVYNGVDDIKTLVPDLSSAEIESTDFGAYTAEQFFDDMGRVTQHRADPDLVELLVTRSFDTLNWMREKGVRFIPIYGRQAFRIDGKFKFWGGLTVEAVGGGPGLIAMLTAAACRRNIDIRYRTRALDLLFDGKRVEGVRVRGESSLYDIRARSVVLACGGFEANAEWRTRYLGPGWDLAKVRGSRFNTGDGIRIALAIGASPRGNWSGCHAVQWEMNAPEFGDLAVGDQFQKHSYPFGILINALGKRFVDEGADFRNYTYAKYGRLVLAQPGQFAWQIFDQKVKHLQRDEYKIRQITKVSANTVEEFAQKLEGVDATEFVKTIREWNKAVRTDVPFNPNIKDGRRTSGLAVDKSNWSNTIDTPPFEGYAVTCGVTFTFGGLRINTEAQVLNTDHEPIRGLYAAGELVGGLFYFNYPGGTGLMSGAVFGKIAGASAGQQRMVHAG
jgi:tricarballylate dehydrogenase